MQQSHDGAEQVSEAGGQYLLLVNLFAHNNYQLFYIYCLTKNFILSEKYVFAR